MTETLLPPRYCPDLFARRRRATRVVMVGNVAVGGLNPIRVQSMTTTDTLDVSATVAQCVRMAQAGCEIIRVTAQTSEHARAIGRIKEGLLRQGISVPLVADIHFDPRAALEAAEFADKVRINPGNFVDSKRFAVREYSDREYADELERLSDRFTPLVSKLKRLGRSLRIGCNHGSLSDRIMNRYGDSPVGMVESALEFVRVCERNGYRDIILSMKSSNPKVMIAAYRLLAARLAETGGDYPFHLGVTEAGEGEDGRVKSAIGIGSLLEDGIGDTIRVSLTEDPEFEVPVCHALAGRFQPAAAVFLSAGPPGPEGGPGGPEPPHCPDFFSYSRRKTRHLKIGPFLTGGHQLVRVCVPVPRGFSASQALSFLEDRLKNGSGAEPELLEWTVRDHADLQALAAARAGLAGETSRLALCGRFEGPAAQALEGLGHVDLAAWAGASDADWQGFVARASQHDTALLCEGESAAAALGRARACRESGVPAVLGLRGSDLGRLVREYRRLAALGEQAPIHLAVPRQDGEQAMVLESSLLLGSLLCDGIGDSVQIEAAEGPGRSLELAYNVLQGAGVRITKAEFVSCPSCGRTLFDLQSTTERIKRRTGHLKGVKIAIMGCIVNGPGEMADADFGYVGGAPGRINLYVGKDCVQKGIPSEAADQALIDLIKSGGKWAEPPAG